MSDSLVQKFQLLILDTIDKQGLIEDSKNLTLEEKPIDQLQLLGALNSLASRDVSYDFFCINVCSLLYILLSKEKVGHFLVKEKKLLIKVVMKLKYIML